MVVKNDIDDYPMWVFGNLLFFLYVRFVVFSDTGSDYTSGGVLLFLIPLVVVGVIGTFIYIPKIFRYPLSASVQFFVASYSIWLLGFFFWATQFPKDHVEESRIEAEIVGLQPSSGIHITAPSAFNISCEAAG